MQRRARTPPRHVGATADQGSAFIYMGSAIGPDNPIAMLTNPTIQSAEFGVSVAGVGDLNGDGYVDLSIGAFRYQSGGVALGAAFVYEGNTARTWSRPEHEFIHPDRTPLGQFGAHLTGGDLNGDGYSDLVVAAPSESDAASPGAVFRYLGSASGLESTALPIASAASNGARVGRRVRTGDINGDGFHDLLFGAPYWHLSGVDEGVVLVSNGGEDLTPSIQGPKHSRQPA